MKKFFPVIHCIDPYTQGGIVHAIANARIAYDNGADGIFLIGHSIVHQELFYIYESVRKQFPGLWIGVNFLDVPVTKIHLLKPYLHADINALWFDSLPNQDHNLPSSVNLFGGIAFKYINANPNDEELKEKCLKASRSINFATTSGNKTGEPPSVEKLAKIKTFLKGKTPLALASGVSAHNVTSFLPFVDAFLVATSITARDTNRGNHEYLLPEKVKELANLIHT